MNFPVPAQKERSRFPKPAYLPAIPKRKNTAQYREETLWVRQIRNGDEAAFATLVRRYEDRVLKVATAILHNAKDAEEVAQDVFMTVLHKIDRFRGDSTLATWIHRIATNTALMRRRRRRASVVSLDDMLPAIDEHGQLPGGGEWTARTTDPALEGEMDQMLSTALGRLDEKYRSVFLLREVQGYSTEETARMLDLRIPAVKTRLHRARLSLRRELAPYFGRPLES